MPKKLPPIHPGEILREEFLKPLNLSVNQVAKALAVDTARLNEIVRERRGITGDTALRLGRYFSMTPDFWMNLQKRYELEVARDAKEKEITRAVRPRNKAAA
jgi:addiction module HigA family antidote